jgi:two-component system, NtrC family, sensor kinase
MKAIKRKIFLVLLLSAGSCLMCAGQDTQPALSSAGPDVIALTAAFLFGIYMFASVMSTLFFFIVRERVYLYFAVSGFFEGISGLATHLAPLSRYPKLFIMLDGLSPFIFEFFLVLFFQLFFNTRRHYRAWHRFITWLAGITLALGIFTYVFAFNFGYLLHLDWNSSEELLRRIATPFVYLCSIACFITLLLFIKSPDRQIRWIVIAALPANFSWAVVYSSWYVLYAAGFSENAFSRFVYANAYFIETVVATWFLFVFSWVLLRRFSALRTEIIQKDLEKALLEKNQELEKKQFIGQQKTELEKQVQARTSELKRSIEDLKMTQQQLIQAEKMASLGELTAGIAHEIQNPLNFVNNFSEVSSELIGELKQEATAGNTNEVIAIAGDLDENLKKITHHGKRADAIVKGMLQHSRTGTGKKEPADINVLADEYLRLSYHGLRAKDKSFNAVPMAIGIKTDFDESINKIEIMPQDIGRVLLNLFNNAFYAVMQKKKVTNDGSYEPLVTVSTKKVDNKVVITVRDNGTGIPQQALDKIYQPFFTTKPTGEGTGLGLSLSYDIVVKGHGGRIDMHTMENEFTEFVVSLPIS